MTDLIVAPAKLREEREKRGWSQRELAERAGVSERAVRYAEAGERRTRGAGVRVLAEALELPVTAITETVEPAELR